MGSRVFWCSVTVILVTLSGPAVALNSSEDPLPFNIDQWLEYPNRKDFAWNVDILKPYLTLQQRFLVAVRAEINCNRLPKSENGHDLHFFLKVASEDNSWAHGGVYTHLPISPQIDEPHYVSFTGGVYLRPGRYTLALIVFDAVSHKGNIQRKQVTVSRLKGDELPHLDRNLENIEFLTEAPQILRVGLVSEPLPWAVGREWLPVKNSRCLCLDIVANLALENNQRNSKEFGKHYANSSHILQAAGVLSHLGLRNGRIRVSVLDTLRVKTLYDRENADTFDWQAAGQDLGHQDDPETIDYDALRAQTEASAYLLDMLHKAAKEDDCTATAESPLKIVIVVSGPMEFAERTPIRSFNPQAALQNGTPIHYYYFRVLHESIIRVFNNSDDDLNAMLIPAEPQTFTIKDSRSFRAALATFISQLEELK